MPNSYDDLIEDTSLLETEIFDTCFLDSFLNLNFFQIFASLCLAATCSFASSKTAQAATLVTTVSSKTVAKLVINAKREEPVSNKKAFVVKRTDPMAVQAFPRPVSSKPSHSKSRRFNRSVVRRGNLIRASFSKEEEFHQWWVRDDEQAFTESETQIPESSTELPIQERVKGVIEGMAQKMGQAIDYTMDSSDNYIGLSEEQKQVKRRVLINGTQVQVIPRGGEIMDNGMRMDNHALGYESAIQQEAYYKIVRPLLAKKTEAETEKIEADVKKTEVDTKAAENEDKRQSKKTDAEVKKTDAEVKKIEAEVKAIEAKQARKNQESEAEVKAIEAKQARKNQESEARVKGIEEESEARINRKNEKHTANQRRKEELHQAKLRKLLD